MKNKGSFNRKQRNF